VATATSRRPTVSPPKKLSLSDAIAGSKKLPSRVVFHGQGGIGKTCFAGHAPKPFFLLSPGETGLHTLIDSGILSDTPNLEVPSWSGLLDVIEELIATEVPHKTLVIDTIDGMEKLANQFVCDTNYSGDWSEKGFMSYQCGFRGVAAGPWRGFLASLDRLREARQMGILLLAHTGVGNHRNPNGSDYSRFMPDMYKDAWQLTYGWADIVLFGNRDIIVEKDKKAKGGAIRTCYSEYDAAWDAKNRHNLPPEIDMGESGKEAWDNFMVALAAGRNGKKKE